MFPTAALLRHRQAGRDAREIRRITQEWFSKPLPPGRTKPWSLAVLVRSRNHLAEIVTEFDNQRLGRIPYRAVDITPLNERQEVLDLTALTRALLHPADRVAALAVLRAPWCGLSLADLHTLTGADDPTLKRRSVLRLAADRAHLLDGDSRQRMARVLAVLQSGAAQRARLTVAQLVERAWRSLGGDAWLNPTEHTNARRFLQLLDSLQTPGIGVDLTVLEERLQKLYAEPNPIPDGTPCVELLTIHNAKGLEWDVVFVPALERMPGRNATRLLNWSEIDSPGAPDDDAADIMLAPIAGRGKESHTLSKWLGRVEFARAAAERQRLFYVACTRARQELHLFATPETSLSGDIRQGTDSLLRSAWPAAEPHFALPAGAATKPAPPAEPPVLALAAAADWSRPTILRPPLAFDPAATFAEARTRGLPCGEPESAAIQPIPVLSPRRLLRRALVRQRRPRLPGYPLRRILEGASPATLLAELPTWAPRIAALLRADGLPRATVDRLARETRAALDKHPARSQRPLAARTPPWRRQRIRPHRMASPHASDSPPHRAPHPSASTASSTPAPNPSFPAKISLDHRLQDHPRPHQPRRLSRHPARHLRPPTRTYARILAPARPNRSAKSASRSTSPPSPACSGGRPPPHPST
jgi:ATP-dependent helicase/nuclease subunit A